MSDIALTVSVLALVAVVGLWIGNIKIRGVGLGICRPAWALAQR